MAHETHFNLKNLKVCNRTLVLQQNKTEYTTRSVIWKIMDTTIETYEEGSLLWNKESKRQWSIWLKGNFKANTNKNYLIIKSYSIT